MSAATAETIPAQPNAIAPTVAATVRLAKLRIFLALLGTLSLAGTGEI